MTARMRTCKLASISLHTNVHAGHRAPIERLLQAFSPKYSTVKYRKVDMMVFRNRENRFKNKTQLTHTHSLAYPLTPLTYSLTQSFIHSLAQSPHHPLAYKHTDTHTHTHVHPHALFHPPSFRSVGPPPRQKILCVGTAGRRAAAATATTE